MDYAEFERILNRTVFDGSKADLIRKIAAHPARYTGLFRPTLPQTKVIQNLLQSHEIRFGDAFEALIGGYISEHGFSVMEKSARDDAGKDLRFDQIFCKQGKLYFAEQKIRDDHDSSKKEGQIANFEKKVKVAIDLQSAAGGGVTGFFYFIDSDFGRKNGKYYAEEIGKLSRRYGAQGAVLHLCYGEEFFALLGMDGVWGEILSHLKKWRGSIPNFPEVDFDKTAQASFDEIKRVQSGVFRKLLSNPQLDEVLRVLFPQGETLRLLSEHFAVQGGSSAKHRELQNICEEAIVRLSRNE